MKVAFDHQIFNLQYYGGISRYFALLAAELLKLNQDVGIFAGVYSNSYLTELPKDVVSGFSLASYPPKSGRLFRYLNQYWVNNRTDSWKPHIIHETYYSNLSNSGYSAPRVTTVYDMIHELFPQMFSAIDRTSKWKRKTLNRVEHIICISKSTKDDLVELFGLDTKKISVVHLGVDTTFFSHPNIPAIEETSRPFLLYVGKRNKYKNFRSLLKALASSKQLKKDFDLVAFGGGSFDFSETKLISSLGFTENRIRQISGSDEKLIDLYQRASALVFPSLYEGFGLPPLEAMACSCPVISSNTSSMPEVIANAGEYFDPSSIDDIKRAIGDVVYSPTRIDNLKELGSERAQHFRWDKCAKETLDVYEKILGKI